LPSAYAGSPVAAKQAEAAQVLAEITSIDQQVGRLSEQWDRAQLQLGRTRSRLRETTSQLVLARAIDRRARERLNQRLVQLYENPSPGTIDLLLGATSLGDLIERLDLSERVGRQDKQIAVQAAVARARLDRERLQLVRTRRAQGAALATLAVKRATIERSLGERERLLQQVRSQIAVLRQQEARRQAELAAQARARLARQFAEQAAAKAARQAAEKAARAATPARLQPPAETDPPQPPPATTSSPPSEPTTTSQPATTTSPPPATTATTPAVLPAGHPQAAAIALNYLGIPYHWGGASPATGFDCSGLVTYVYAQLGISLPHLAAAQYQLGTPVPESLLQPGDLVFFDGLNHVGVYIGNGQFVHAPQTGDVVKISDLSGNWQAGYVGARRI
jgi:cell wall-associated NlpC family hydrolase